MRKIINAGEARTIWKAFTAERLRITPLKFMRRNHGEATVESKGRKTRNVAKPKA